VFTKCPVTLRAACGQADYLQKRSKLWLRYGDQPTERR
jgi:hypothetical protein